MGRKCGVLGCQSESQRQEDLGVTFHKVPFHPDIRPKWLQLCQITDNKKVIYVCSRHFLRADFCNFKGKKYMLKQGVLPSIFAWNKKPAKVVDPPPAPPPPTNEVKLEVDELQIKTENLEAGDDMLLSPTNSTTIEQKIQTVNTTTGALTFVPNTRIEALDFKQNWKPATILEVDYEENEVLVHFDMYSSKYDEWIGVNSNSIRAPTVEEPVKKADGAFDEGERCMASWSDARKFPATVTKVLDNGMYEVLFDDGYIKTLKGHRMSKCSLTAPQRSPLFQPVIGTKEERRNKKRKINVSSLFKKKSKANQDAPASQPPPITVPEVPVEPKIDEVKPENQPVTTETWYPSWKDDQPVGTDSMLYMSDGFRKSVVVPDPRLPPGWQKHMTQRPFGSSAGKWDTIIVSPEGKKLRLKSEVKQYIEDNPHLNLSESMFDFMVHKKRKKKQSPPPVPTPEKPRESTPPPQLVPEVPPEADKSSLKIIQVDGGFKCPIEGCGKNFRRENLAQMHVKHYHPKYTKFFNSTPNVADLAYARTVGESLDRSPGPEKRETRPSKPKVSTPKPPPKADVENSESQKDSEIIKLLNSKPFESLDSSTAEPLPPGLPPSMYPDIKLKDLLVKSEPVPKSNDLNLKTLSASTSRPTGLKTLLPVKKEEEQTPVKSGRRDAKRKRIMSEFVECKKENKQEAAPSVGELEAVPVQAPVPAEHNEATDFVIEGGEVIKIVRMKQEEIINCTCGITEEDGLMIQCELCLCWQHAYCNNIQKENEVPEKYVCYICQHPARQRNSKKYVHDQDWLKHGTLPTAAYHCRDEEAQGRRFEKLKVSHDLSGGLLELKDFMHTLKLKIKIAEAKNHPKLYLWSKPWEKAPLPEKQEIKQEIKEEPIADDHPSESMLLNLLKSSKDDAKMSEFPKLDINTIMDSNLDSIHAPQPEAAIESADCRLNLLEHISHCQNLVEERLGDFERQINELDSNLADDNDEQYARVRHTTSMLLRDLDTLKELSQISTF